MSAKCFSILKLLGIPVSREVVQKVRSWPDLIRRHSLDSLFWNASGPPIYCASGCQEGAWLLLRGLASSNGELYCYIPHLPKVEPGITISIY